MSDQLQRHEKVCGKESHVVHYLWTQYIA
jgi:hypothetical protein